MVLHCHLRQQQAAPDTLFDQQSMLPDFNCFRLNSFQGGQQRYFNLQPGQFFGLHRRESWIFQGRLRGASHNTFPNSSFA